ncbi:MAG TPA: heavy metal-associated domain-containing protein [Solirubrobacteraceae bacterium]|nr:heavy metal-associated domain-containing protein [Solirubrobacteraceae bacterium]
MECACCAEAIEEGVRALPAVRRAGIDLPAATLTVEGDAGGEQIRAAVRAAGYRCAGDPAGPTAPELAHGRG